MSGLVERWTGLAPARQVPAFVVAIGHGGTHWIIGTLYLLLPYIKESLGLSYAAAGALITVFHASSFSANFVSGMVVDLSGRRVVVQVGSLVAGAAALFACRFADGPLALAALVAIIGATNNMWHPAAISFLSQLYPDNRGYALSIHTLGASLGDTVAPAAVGAMLVWASWQDTAAGAAAPVVVAAFAIALYLLSRERRLAAAQSSGRPGFRGHVAGVRMMFRDRGVMGLALMSGFRSMTQSGLLVFIPMYLANVLQVGPLLTGIGVMAMQLGGMVAGPMAGAWSDRAGRRRVVLAGLTGTTVVIVVLTLLGNEIAFIAGVSVLGFLLLAVRPVIHSWMMDLSPPSHAGSATSVLFGAQSAFSIVIPVAGGVVADAFGVPSVFYLLAASMLVANVLVYLLPDPEGAAAERSGG